MKISDLLSKNNLAPYVNQTNASNQPEKTSPSQEAKNNSPTGRSSRSFDPIQGDAENL